LQNFQALIRDSRKPKLETRQTGKSCEPSQIIVHDMFTIQSNCDDRALRKDLIPFYLAATLEAAFFRLPFVLIYKVAATTYLAGRMLIRVKHLGMPNVLADREIVPEFIQGNAQPSAIAAAVANLLDDCRRREQMRVDFDEVISKLGKGGANDAAARAILKEIDRG
jgi:hypothetical protein